MDIKKYVETYHPNGVLQYEGMTVNGQANGFGKFYYPSGRLQYEGNLLNNCAHGKGTAYDEDGTEIYSGEFINGKPANAQNYANNLTEYEFQDENLLDDNESNETSEEDLVGIEKYIDDLNSLIGLTNVKKDLNESV